MNDQVVFSISKASSNWISRQVASKYWSVLVVVAFSISSMLKE